MHQLKRSKESVERIGRLETLWSEKKIKVEESQQDALAHPIGATSRLSFEWWNEQNIQHIQWAKKLWGNSKVTEFIGGPFNQKECLERLSTECRRSLSDGYQYWPLFTKIDHLFIGVCGLQRYEGETSQAHGFSNMVEVGFHLLPEYWRKGYAMEAADAVISYALDKFDAVYGGHHPSNKASSAALLRLGFVCVGKEFYPITGLMHPSYIICRDNNKNLNSVDNS
jgi:RimJ/RimL family protein N-acetyltransferase